MRWSDTAGTDLASLALLAAAAAAAAALGAGWAIRHARRNDLIDHPGDRRSHVVPTPRGGGIGMVVACLCVLVALAVTQPGAGYWWLVAAGLAMVAAIGWWDDHRALPAWPRLAVHALAAMCLAAAAHASGAAAWVVVAAFALALVLVNAWNFMDGINGLATSQAMLCAVGFAIVLVDGGRSLAVVLAGACLGFLPFNAPRARVFLGDVGSGALGYMVALLLVLGFASRPWPWWPALLLPPLAMLADAGLTLLWRAARRERWWEAHVQHAFQRWSRHAGHGRVCVAYAVWTFAAVALMLVALHAPARVALGVALAGLLASACAWGWLHRRHDKNKTEGFGA